MATSKRRMGVRSTRKLRDWTVEQVESGKFPGLVWDDPPAKTMFRIPWKHAGKQEFRQEEDAGFFKAWAIYKGKYNPGECNPATWKTRIRCALSKSPEFEEVPSRSRLDITEPYKVYRLVPVMEQMLGKKAKPQKSKRGKMDESSSPEAEAPRPSEEMLPLPADSLLPLEGAETPAPEAMGSHASNAFNPPSCQNGQVSPQAAEPAPDVNEILNLRTDPTPVVMVADGPTADFSFCVSISYEGELVCQYLLPEGEFLITSVLAPLNSPANCLKRVILPAPVKMADGPKKIIQHLLKDLEKGIMVASNCEGIFIQCRGKACVSWSGFLTSEDQTKLENNTHQQLFRVREFQSAVEQYKNGLGPLPSHQVILYVGDELDGNGCRDSKPIVIQMEQMFAVHLLLRSSSL